MEVRNEILYAKLKSYLEGVCGNSLDWRRGSPKFEDLLGFMVNQTCVADTARWWEPDVEYRGEISKWMSGFSYLYQDMLGRLAWDENVFNEIYKMFENFLYDRDLIATSVSPLYLFRCGLGEPVELDTDVGIMPRGYDINIKRLLNHFETEGKHFSEDYGWFIYAHRKISKSQPRESSSDNNTDTTKLEDVLMSLRLLHGGPVHAGPLHSDDASPFAGIHGGHRLLTHSILKRLPADYIVFESFELKSEEIESMQQIYKQLTSLNEHDRKFLGIPLGRFHDSYERPNERDKLIDLCIALESLYVREKDELAYRLALRCACFLEGGQGELENTFHRVKNIYDRRSEIVHGTAKDLAEEQLSRLVTEAEEYVRRSICKLLSDIRLISRISKKPDKNELHFLDKAIFEKHARDV